MGFWDFAHDCPVTFLLCAVTVSFFGLLAVETVMNAVVKVFEGPWKIRIGSSPADDDEEDEEGEEEGGR